MYGNTYDYEKSFTNIHISWQEIINTVDQLDLWSWFFGYPVSLGQPVCNPMRVDTHANCFLDWGFYKKEFIVLNDFADRKFHGMTVFDAMMHQYYLSFDAVCQKIYTEFIVPGGYKLGSVPFKAPGKEEFRFILEYIPWTLNGREVFIPEDKLFWSQYGITSSQLKRDNVKSNRQIIFNSRHNPGSFQRMAVTPSYTYLFESGRRKCYQPYHDKWNKWKSTCTEEDVGGWNNLTNDNLVITKSYKDWRVLKNSGYNTIWLQNEGCKIPWDKLIRLQGIKTKFILFDNDKAGITAGQELAAYCNQFDNSYIPIHFDSSLPKDSADVVKTYSNDVLKTELSNLGVK